MNKTRPFAKKTKMYKKTQTKLLAKKNQKPHAKKNKTNTFCEKQQNKTEQNKTYPLSKQSKPLTRKKKPLQITKPCKIQKKTTFFCKKKHKTKPHHSFERKPLFLKNKKKHTFER